MTMPKATRHDRLWILYTASFLLVVLFYMGLQYLLPYLYSRGYGNIYIYMYDFMLQCWPVQFSSTWLFVIGFMYWVLRYRSFKREYEVYRIISLPKGSITREEAPRLIQQMPEKYHSTVTFRRFRELLHAFSRGEEIIRLNEELSRRDLAEIEQGHSILDSIRNLIPVLGFLGTVIGLSMGMIAFPDIENIELLRKALRSFAASLSVAFNTTLLALVYSIIIILLTSFLRQREEVLVGSIDEHARTLVGKTKVGLPAPRGTAGVDLSDIRVLMTEFLASLSEQNAASRDNLGKAVMEIGKTISSKLDDLKLAIQQPPHYQIVVKPGLERRDEKE